MLDPIDTWTSRSLQFQPPATQPSGVSCQPFPPSTTRTARPAAAATIQPGASSRAARANPARVGRPSGANQRWRTHATSTAAAARTTALTMIASRPNPVKRATTFTRCAEAYVLVTTAAPTAADIRMLGTTRRTTTHPGTKNRIGQTRTIDVSGRNQATMDPPTIRSAATPTAMADGGLLPAPATASAGGSTAVDDSDHDRADDPACRPRRVLRGGRAARQARAARPAGRRRWRRWRGRTRRRVGRQLRGTPVRDPLGD